MADPIPTASDVASALTPLRRQYLQLKRRYPDAILLFRLGDFYEAFDDDAKLISVELEIVLTGRDIARGQRIPMAGVPHHSLEGHVAKLVKKGYRVAVCEQLGDLKSSKGLVERDVTRIVTPGTVVEPGMLDDKRNNYLAAIVTASPRGNGTSTASFGLAYVDVTTGELATTQIDRDDTRSLEREIERLGPAEIIVPRGGADEPGFAFEPQAGIRVTTVDAWKFELASACEVLCRHFDVRSLEGFGCAGLPLATRAAGAVLQYLDETRRATLSQIAELRTYHLADYMLLDAATRQNLELEERTRGGSAAGSLIWVLDRTKTSGGARLLRRWLNQPLVDVDRLQARLDAVDEFYDDTPGRARLREQLAKLRDVERLTTRVGHGVATPRDLLALKSSLDLVPAIQEVLAAPAAPVVSHPARRKLAAELDPCPAVSSLIGDAIAPEPTTATSDSPLIREGFSTDLDELRASTEHARRWIENLEPTERERTGIRGLKVGYNRVFGYYLEISNANREAVPANYLRKQTLVGAERYVTPELKEYETIVLNARERIAETEQALFRQICGQIASERQRLLRTADALARADVVATLAEVAVQNQYVRPEIDDSTILQVVGGRHPVVEEARPDDPFTPNDLTLSSDDAQIALLTGPNMAGKSTFLRQIALIVLLAQIGSYVPATSARIGLVDRIFTRVGARDDLGAGQSTFMVEMLETANLLTQSTRRSLLILDEVGRGTSTYDGLAIAQAIVEYIHNHPRLGARTLFATHYHELTELAKVLPRVRNFRMDVREEGNEVHFLHRVVPGGADRSYGVHVARLAGVPRAVTRRAEEILRELERKSGRGTTSRRRDAESDGFQLSLLAEPHPAVEEIRALDVLSLTPIEAIAKLFELQQKVRIGSSGETEPPRR